MSCYSLQKRSRTGMLENDGVRARIRPLSGFLAALTVLLLIILIQGCSSGQERMAAYLKAGKALFEQGNYVKASLELKNALQIDPKVAEAHYLLGRIAEHDQDWRATYGHYKATVELDPHHREARLRLGRLAILAGQPDEALAMADAILRDDPADLDAQTLRAMVHARQDKTEEAIAETTRILASRPAQSDAAVLLATIYQRRGKAGQAMQTLQAAIEAAPNDVSLHLALAQFNVLAGHVDEAEHWLRRLIEIEPQNLAHRRRLVRFLQANGRHDEAEAMLRKDLADAPDDNERLLTLTDFLAKNRSLADAESLLEHAIVSRPDDIQRRFALGRLYEVAQLHDKAQATYRAILEGDIDDRIEIAAKDGLARSLFESGHDDQAQQLVKEVLDQNPGDHEALLVRGRLAMKRHDLPAAIGDFRSLLRDLPDSPNILRLLAQAQLLNGQAELALSNLDKAIAVKPGDGELRLAKARIQVSRNDIEGALETVQALLAIDPTFSPAIDLQTRLLAANQKWDEAKKSANKLIEADPKHPQGQLQLGEIYLRMRDYESAVTAYGKAVELAPGSFEAWTGLIRSQVAAGQVDQARHRVQALLANNDNHPFAHELLAEIAQFKGQMVAAESAYRKAIASQPKWPLPVLRLADLYLRQQAYDKAIDVYRQALTRIDQPLLAIRLAELETRTGNIDEAIAIYRKLITSHPELDVAANNLAVLLIKHHGDDEKERSEALALARRFATSDNPYYLDTLGWIYYRSGEAKQARTLLERGASSGKAPPELHYHLARIYLDEGAQESARRELVLATSGPAFDEQAQAKALLATLALPD